LLIVASMSERGNIYIHSRQDVFRIDQPIYRPTTTHKSYNITEARTLVNTLQMNILYTS
jgi:hypothetical protein